MRTTEFARKLSEMTGKNITPKRLRELESYKAVPMPHRDNRGWRKYFEGDLQAYAEVIMERSGKLGRPKGSNHEALCKECPYVRSCLCPHNTISDR